MAEKKTSKAAERAARDISHSWTLSADKALQYYNVNPKIGLSEQKVKELREEHGFNELPAEEGTFENHVFL